MSRTKESEAARRYYDGESCLNAMMGCYGRYAVRSFCLCNAMKYLWRCNKKHLSPLEDIKKAKWYIEKAIEILEYEQDNVPVPMSDPTTAPNGSDDDTEVPSEFDAMNEAIEFDRNRRESRMAMQRYDAVRDTEEMSEEG